MLKIYEIVTMAASNPLKKSRRNIPFDAKIFKMISMKKNVRKAKSIVPIVSGFTFKDSATARSKRMITVYIEIMNRENISTLANSRVLRTFAWNFGI
jgi:hypothetical protein